MRPATHDATARRNFGEPSPFTGQAGDGSSPRRPDVAAEGEIAGLADRSTHELRLAWRKSYRGELPLGLSRDLMIRALANLMQAHAYGGPSASMKRRLNTLAGEFEKRGSSFDPGVVAKTSARLVRQWRGHAHTVLVVEDGFEYEGQHYRSLTMIAARITGAIGRTPVWPDHANLSSAVQGLTSKCWTSASGRLCGGKPFARGALYRMLGNRIY